LPNRVVGREWHPLCARRNRAAHVPCSRAHPAALRSHVQGAGA
jgi:hypothetical protein